MPAAVSAQSPHRRGTGQGILGWLRSVKSPSLTRVAQRLEAASLTELDSLETRAKANGVSGDEEAEDAYLGERSNQPPAGEPNIPENEEGHREEIRYGQRA